MSLERKVATAVCTGMAAVRCPPGGWGLLVTYRADLGDGYQARMVETKLMWPAQSSEPPPREVDVAWLEHY